MTSIEVTKTINFFSKSQKFKQGSTNAEQSYTEHFLFGVRLTLLVPSVLIRDRKSFDDISEKNMVLGIGGNA